MDEIKTAFIIGAGALGMLYAEMMSKSQGSCSFLADKARCDRLKSDEFTINSKKHSFSAVCPDDIENGKIEKPDLIVVAVKNHNIAKIIELLQAAVKENTVIISVLNGIESEEILGNNFPEARVIHTVAVGMDAVKEDNRLNYTKRGKLLIGTANNDKDDPALLRLAAFFESCAMEYEIPDDIVRALWWKWMINIGVNQVSAVTGANYGIFHTDPEIQRLMDSAMLETVHTAKAVGVALTEDDIRNWYPILHSLGAENKTSMLQDIEAERKTEVEAFSGRLISIAETRGLAVPVNRTLYSIIKTKELLYK